MKTLSMRDMLYEEPGPVTKKRIRFFTGLAFLALAGLLWAVIRRFYVTGQFASRY